ncbi:hypothetical protein diail_3065 [Diaporthe ilicicola]|nr:hypothetical protein diail_3065 [Diaporthe ilicicola]
MLTSADGVIVPDPGLTISPCGWDRETREVEQDLLKQIDRAFDNVEHALGLAGAGWKDVYAAKLYHTDVPEEAVGHFVENMRKYMPDHQPILSGVRIASLAFGMKVEIEVRAHAPPPVAEK